MKVLIPAYEPDKKLIVLLCEIKADRDMGIVLADDGSGEKYAPIFRQAEEMGCTVLRHPRNLGKGAALKTGFRYLLQHNETLLKFSTSSMAAGLLDFVLLLGFQSLFGQLLCSVILSRMISSAFNYACNKYLVFNNRQQKNLQSAPKYFLLAAVIMLLNYALLRTVLLTGLPLAIAKILTEMVLFLLSYIVQKRFVFVHPI